MSRDQALKPIRRAPLYQQVAAQLSSWIDQERLQPGDRLPPERELAERLGVSRTSVRQALTALQTLGLVHARHGDGVYLRRTAADVRPELAAELLSARGVLPRIMEVREALEVQIARLAARRRTDEDLAALEAALEEMEAAIDREADTAEADEHFHLALADAAGNPLLADLLRQIAEPVALTRRASLAKPGRPSRSLEGHRRITRAVREGDEDAAAAAMYEHLLVVADVASGDA